MYCLLIESPSLDSMLEMEYWIDKVFSLKICSKAEEEQNEHMTFSKKESDTRKKYHVNMSSYGLIERQKKLLIRIGKKKEESLRLLNNLHIFKL